MVGKSFLDFGARRILTILEKIIRNTNANAQRHHTITGVGIAINLPKAPEVLINNVAKLSSNSRTKWSFFIHALLSSDVIIKSYLMKTLWEVPYSINASPNNPNVF